MQLTALAVSIDTTQIQKGLVGIQYSGTMSKIIKVTVEANGNKNVYTVPDNTPNFVPLQMGNGTYKITVLENVSGTKYKPLKTETIEVKNVDVNTMFTSPSFLANFNASMEAIKGYMNLTKEKQAKEAIELVYADLVKGYSYDFSKINNLPTDYVPVIDEMYKKKAGICYDYTVLMAAALRSKGIPTKIVMGYAPGVKEYHAWNEILIDGKWVAVDTTYDSQMYKAKVEYSFAKDASKRSVVKIY
jgi:hypothetical protein